MDVVETEEREILTTAVVSVPTLGDEYNDAIAALLQEIFREADNFREQTVDFSTVLLADVRIPVVHIDSLSEDEDLMSLVVIPLEESGLWFGLTLNEAMFQSIFDFAEEELWQSLSIEDFTVTIYLINDLRETVVVELDSVYVNREPILYPEEFELKRRDSLEIVLADISRDYAFKHGFLLFGSMD